jgi:hypothetical protein
MPVLFLNNHNPPTECSQPNVPSSFSAPVSSFSCMTTFYLEDRVSRFLWNTCNFLSHTWQPLYSLLWVCQISQKNTTLLSIGRICALNFPCHFNILALAWANYSAYEPGKEAHAKKLTVLCLLVFLNNENVWCSVQSTHQVYQITMAKLVQFDDVVCLVCAHIQVVFKNFYFVWFLLCKITKSEKLNSYVFKCNYFIQGSLKK